MNYIYDFHATEFLWTLAVGLPIFVVAAWLSLSRAKTSLRWRVFLCTLAACVIAPIVLIDDEGTPAGPAVIDVMPAVTTLPLLVGAIPIFLVAVLLVAAWWAITSIVTRTHLEA